MILKRTLILFVAILVLQNSYSQTDHSSLHNGFQFGFYAGAGFGDVKGKTSDGINPVFRGSSMLVSFDFGYAVQDWAFGLFGSMNGLTIKTVEVNDTSYAIQPGFSMDHSISGIYVSRYFMPLNAYIKLRGGIGKFTLSDAEFNELGSTDRGFGWALVAGKEFLIGKKKLWGIGGYVSIQGIKCKDVPPFANDTYTYFAPGLGVSISYH